MIVEEKQTADLEPVYDPDTGAYHVRYEPSGPASLEFTVISAVGALGGAPETALGDVLYDCVDPDAVDAVLETSGDRSRTASAGVWFRFAGHWVVARTGGDIAVYPPGIEPPSVPPAPGPDR